MTDRCFEDQARGVTWGKPATRMAVLFACLLPACGVQDADSDDERSAVGASSDGRTASLRGVSGPASLVSPTEPGPPCGAISVETVAAARGTAVLDTSVLRIEQTAPMTVTITRRDFVEVQERRASGLEQSWRFDQAPGQTGDLVIVVHLPAVSYLGRVAAGLHFQGQACDVVYGDGTWIDAAGRRVALPARADQGAVALLVPADVVATSMYPVLLDPEIEVDPR